MQQAGNALDTYRVDGEVPGGPVLLVDALVHSQWTLTVVGMSAAPRRGDGRPAVRAGDVGVVSTPAASHTRAHHPGG